MDDFIVIASPSVIASAARQSRNSDRLTGLPRAFGPRNDGEPGRFFRGGHKTMTIRVDLNVPLDSQGNILNDRRIRAIVPTLKEALKANAGIILLSHLGRPKAGVFDPRYSLAPVADALSTILEQPVTLVRDWLGGVQVSPGSIVLCENVRFQKGETQNDPILAQRIAALSDLFVMDAFAVAHRIEASTVGAIHYAAKAVAGTLLMSELSVLKQVCENPKRPSVAIMGGAKISDKLDILDNLLEKVDSLIVGGAMANTFLAALGVEVGTSLYEADQCAKAMALLQKAKDLGVDLLLPQDVVTATSIDAKAQTHVRAVSKINVSEKILDIGPATCQSISERIANAATLLWNGPVGLYECAPFAKGTAFIAQSIAAAKGFSVVGGGETVDAIDQLNLGDCVDHLSTGGGAFLAYLSGKPLAAVAALEARF